MAKKKKSHKKHQFKYAAPTGVISTAGPEAAKPVIASAKPAALPTLNYEVANLPLIKQDVRKVLLLALSFVVLQLILWFLFEHTGLGSAVYHLIKV